MGEYEGEEEGGVIYSSLFRQVLMRILQIIA